jgi:hypothetical protein
LGEQVMPNLTSRFRIRFRCQNIEAAIDLKGIGVDDLGIELFRHVNRERGFSDSGGTNDKKNASGFRRARKTGEQTRRRPHLNPLPVGEEDAKRQVRAFSQFPNR